MDWSHDALSELERAVLRSVAIFVGRFSLDAALAVAKHDGADQSDLACAVAGLVEKSLIATRHDAGELGRRLAGDASLTAPMRADSESEWQDWLPDDTAVSQETRLADDEERSIRMGLLQEAMQELTDRERHILTERRLKDDPTTLEDLAAEYGVSRERVRQIEVRAFEKLQKAMRAAAEERNLVSA